MTRGHFFWVLQGGEGPYELTAWKLPGDVRADSQAWSYFVAGNKEKLNVNPCEVRNFVLERVIWCQEPNGGFGRLPLVLQVKHNSSPSTHTFYHASLVHQEVQARYMGSRATVPLPRRRQ